MTRDNRDYRVWELSAADKRRKKILAHRLREARESLGLRREDMEKVRPELTWARIKQWENPNSLDAKPRADGFLVLSRVFSYPMEYFWPWLPEDSEAKFELEEVWQERNALFHKVRDGAATPEEIERYQQLLVLESKMVASPATVQRPTLHLVCVIRKLPVSPDELPGVEDAWDGAWVVPVPGASPAEQVYAFKLPSDCGMPAGTTVIFRPIYDGRPSQERWTIGNRRGAPVVFRRDLPENTTVIGEVLLALYEPKL